MTFRLYLLLLRFNPGTYFRFLRMWGASGTGSQRMNRGDRDGPDWRGSLRQYSDCDIQPVQPGSIFRAQDIVGQATFGTISAACNQPRQIQLSGRFVF